ncbi:MAG: hypothetical protein WBW33_25920, partial [Bryobacteraceae bacterium]
VLEAPGDRFWEELIQQGGYDVLAAPLSETAATRTIQFACVFRRRRSRFRTDADHDSGVMAISIGAKRRWLVS